LNVGAVVAPVEETLAELRAEVAVEEALIVNQKWQ
jgi:hypothetical protein